MHAFPSRFTLGLVATILPILSFGSSPATAAEPWSALTVTPTTVQAGGSVHMSGYCRVNGYPATPSLDYYWLNPPAGAAPYGPIVPVTADAQGSFDLQVPIGVEAPSGAYRASLDCVLGDVIVTSPVTADFVVEGGSDPVITTTSSSTSTTVGSTVPSTLSVSTLGTVAPPPAARPASPAVARRGSAAFTG